MEREKSTIFRSARRAVEPDAGGDFAVSLGLIGNRPGVAGRRRRQALVGVIPVHLDAGCPGVGGQGGDIEDTFDGEFAAGAIGDVVAGDAKDGADQCTIAGIAGVGRRQGEGIAFCT